LRFARVFPPRRFFSLPVLSHQSRSAELLDFVLIISPNSKIQLLLNRLTSKQSVFHTMRWGTRRLLLLVLAGLLVVEALIVPVVAASNDKDDDDDGDDNDEDNDGEDEDQEDEEAAMEREKERVIRAVKERANRAKQSDPDNGQDDIVAMAKARHARAKVRRREDG
jgi:hypothetical protein